ncbi:TIGR03943 family putative permease subunit [Anaerotignum lactatifermentans]|uniref:TIGR03943 family putative permease subunit n=1 Tax=Anaerotignum lactatifermentans TaxID=160404 RepID=UPI00255CD7A4|nr:hypothetical protein [Anaerotignum lactatifermentans]
MKRPFLLLIVMIFIWMLSGCQPKTKTTRSETEPPSQEPQTTYTLEDILEKNNPTPVEPQRPISESTLEKEDVLEISEKMYLTQIQDIFLNFSDYEDKTIVVEGMYGLLFNPEGIKNTPAVYRRGPGCCGNDGWGGFLLRYDGTYPDENAWIRVTGTPEIVENGHYRDLYLNVSEIEVLETRGEEFVTQ